MEKQTVDRYCRSYVIGSLCLVCAVTLLGGALSQVLALGGMGGPLAVGAGFTLATDIADALIWRKVAKGSSDCLPTFYTAVSGFRMLLALATLFAVYMTVGRDAMMPYCIAFMAYYFIQLAHHSIFFSRASNALSKES